MNEGSLRDDGELLRRDRDNADAARSREPNPQAVGAARIAAVTVQVTAYPTAAACFYGFRRRVITGTEAEGGLGTETLAPGDPEYAFNLGNAIPPVGSRIEVLWVPHRYTFTYGSPRAT